MAKLSFYSILFDFLFTWISSICSQSSTISETLHFWRYLCLVLTLEWWWPGNSFLCCSRTIFSHYFRDNPHCLIETKGASDKSYFHLLLIPLQIIFSKISVSYYDFLYSLIFWNISTSQFAVKCMLKLLNLSPRSSNFSCAGKISPLLEVPPPQWDPRWCPLFSHLQHVSAGSSCRYPNWYWIAHITNPAFPCQ